jgi:formylglycine-generating enzyme required for sulfatase activity
VVGKAALTIAAVLAGCTSAPFGEVLVNVDSEPTVPGFVGQLRIDLYTPSGTWYQSRDVVTPDPLAWPISFSLYTDGPDDKTVRMRLRAFREGNVRDYQGERFDDTPFVEPPSAHSLAELCADPPELPPATSRIYRRARDPVTELIAQNDCKPPTKAGSIAVKIVIPTAGAYHFGVVPFANDLSDLGSDSTLFLRTACSDPASQLACADDTDAAAGDYHPELDATLQPGTYFLITGGKTGSPNDVTLRWDEAGKYEPIPAPKPVDGVAGKPLTVDGGPTPTDEPEPTAAIDRLIDVAVAFGERRTTDVLLRGECMGTQADLFGGRTCTDTAGQLVPVDQAPLRDGIERATTSVQGSWVAERSLPCAIAPRPRSPAVDGVELYDEEVCVPGGAFRIGDIRVVGVAIDSIPERAAVVEPFLLDKYEYTVARYRRALAAGFVSTDDTPWIYDNPIDPNDMDLSTNYACTLTTKPNGREDEPLSCVSYYTARALCQLEGGDLPTHVMWEFAATAAGSKPGEKTLYPWGDDPPTCDRTVFALGSLDNGCEMNGVAGPQPVAKEPWASRDLTPAGVSGMGGNIGEWTLDSIREYQSRCWDVHPLHGVSCNEIEAPLRSARGGAWPISQFDIRSATLAGFDPRPGNFVNGFRCARKATP